MRVTFAHLCDYALISNDGKLSLIGITDTLFVPALPFNYPSFAIAFQIELNHAEINREFPMRLDIMGPDGEVLLRMEAKGAVQGTPRVGTNTRFGQVVTAQGVQFKTEGPHSVNIWLDGRPEQPIEFAVSVHKPVPAGPTK